MFWIVLNDVKNWGNLRDIIFPQKVNLIEMSEQVFEYLLGTVLLEPCFKVHRIAKITNAVLPPPIG